LSDLLLAGPVANDPEPTLDFASHNTKKRHSRPARGGMADDSHFEMSMPGTRPNMMSQRLCAFV